MAAYEVAMEGGERAKVRDPGLVLLWTILTLGVYDWFWYYSINREMRDFGRARGDAELAAGRPGLSLLAVTLGWFLVVPPFVSWWRATNRVQRTQELGGVVPVSGWLIFACFVAGIVMSFGWLAIPAIVQDGLNKVWKRYPGAAGEAGTVDAAAAVAASGGAAPATETLPSRADVKLPEGRG
jgi:hypothetical protein